MAKSPLSVTRFRIIFSISWLIILADFAIVLRWFGLPWRVSIIDSLITNIILLLACLLIMNTLRFYTPRKERYLNIMIWCLFLTGAWLVLSRWLLVLSLGYYEGYTSFLDRSLIIRASIGFLLLGCITLICALWYNWSEQQETERRKQDAEKLAREAELFKLRQQLQPHFLFNSLNSINALIGTRPQEAREMIQQLSDFLRGTLKKEEHQWISLSEEMQYLQLYLEIEKVRFGNRLSTRIEIDETTREMKIPVLLLQPVVENAIKFGLYDTTDEIVINIIARVEENNLLVIIQNPFDPQTAQPRQGTGFGLTGVKRRLDLLFARNDLLTTDTKENIFTTSIKVPQHV
jgi:two-component system, LytTR family, sensor kinase